MIAAFVIAAFGTLGAGAVVLVAQHSHGHPVVVIEPGSSSSSSVATTTTAGGPCNVGALEAAVSAVARAAHTDLPSASLAAQPNVSLCTVDLIVTEALSAQERSRLVSVAGSFTLRVAVSKVSP